MQRITGTASVGNLTSPTEVESQEARSLADLLENLDPQEAALVPPSGKALHLPRPVYELLLQVLRDLAQGKAVSLVTADRELTTQQAADILNVSRPFLIARLERGDIPFHKVGTHRRVPLPALLEYKSRRDQARRSALAQMTQEAQESGLYQ